jgi:hypothetical protein
MKRENEGRAAGCDVMEWWLATVAQFDAHRGGCGILRWVDRMWTVWLLALGDAGVLELELGWHMCGGMEMQWDNTARGRERAVDANAETTSNKEEMNTK